MDKIKGQLAGVAALLGVIAAIGGGFVKYGEITTKLDALASQESADYSAQIAVLEEKVAAMGVEHGHTKILVNEKEIQLLKVQIEEIKVSTKNPLSQ
tara:strand:+ start:588 stop:878 length:291 start_codon:yes stop_codon:yes gene_type:complete